MHPYFMELIDLKNAEEALKDTIERVAKECNINICVKFYPGKPLVKVVGNTAIIEINEKGVVEEMKQLFGNVPIEEGWAVFLATLAEEIDDG